jgi:hypothetical protein
MTPLFLFIFEILQCIQYIHSISFIQNIHPLPFAEVSPFPHRWSTHWEKPSWGAEPRIELGPSLRRAAPSLSYAAHLTVLRRILLTYLLLNLSERECGNAGCDSYEVDQILHGSQTRSLGLN